MSTQIYSTLSNSNSFFCKDFRPFMFSKTSIKIICLNVSDTTPTIIFSSKHTCSNVFIKTIYQSCFTILLRAAQVLLSETKQRNGYRKLRAFLAERLLAMPLVIMIKIHTANGSYSSRRRQVHPKRPVIRRYILNAL